MLLQFWCRNFIPKYKLLTQSTLINFISTLIQQPRINNQIRSSEVRVIGRDGSNLGVLPLAEALAQAAEAGLDLIEVSEKANPPVVRIMDYGKYQYQKEKEARLSIKKQKGSGEMKTVRVGFNASQHDMEFRARQANEFLLEAGRAQVDFILKGRAKYLDRNFIKQRLETFLGLITTPYRKATEPKRGPRGLILIIERDKDAKNKQISNKTPEGNKNRENFKTASG